MPLLLASASGQTTQPPAFSERVEVTASRLPERPVPARRVISLTRDDIARLPVSSVQELLLYVAGAGVVRRGAHGLQADSQLRGATFEQVVVLVNGVRVNDPQTGHFHLDIPLPLAAVDRVDVLLGPGSAVHGPDAFGGVVSISTAPLTGASAKATVGQHGLLEGRLAAPLGRGWVALSRASSDGFRPDTDFDALQASAGWRGAVADWEVQVDGAFEDKEFGAWAFYSQRFPNQAEEISRGLLSAVAARTLGATTLAVRAGARAHHDTFVLERSDPDWYRNTHRGRSGLLQATLTGRHHRLAWSLGAEAERQDLASSRLGDHQRGRHAVFGEGAWQQGRLALSGQLRFDHTGELGWQASPGLSAEVELSETVTVGYHHGRSFRLPSFTELYYDSPATVGNPDLEAEHAAADELLLRAGTAGVAWELAVFRRVGSELIDFVRDDDGIYRAVNHARVATDGIEVAALLGGRGSLRTMRLSAAWLQSRLDTDPARSRYVLAHPRWEVAATTLLDLPGQVASAVALRWRDPIDRGSYAVVDLRLRRYLGSAWSVELDASNLLDRNYQELGGVPMAGRWLSLSLLWEER